MTKEIQELTKEMTSLLERTYNDLASILVGFDGNLKDIECGTRIKIPTGAGSVSFYRSENSCTLSLWIKEEMLLNEPGRIDGEVLKNLSP